MIMSQQARPLVVIAQFLAILAACAAQAGASVRPADADYNMPPAVTATLAPDAAMMKMEAAVAPDVLAAFERAHPAPLWLFGEDRQYAVRNSIIPAHWFAAGAKQHGRFSGIARPGEFYVFQLCVIGGAQDLRVTALNGTLDELKGTAVQLINRPPKGQGSSFPVAPGTVKPFWFGIQFPEDLQAGTYHGSIELAATPRNPSQLSSPAGKSPAGEYHARLAFTIKVEGAPLKESGTGEAWRLARLKWLDSTIGESETTVTAPFTPLTVDERTRTLGLLGRRITLSESGIPARFTSFFSGSNTRILPTGREAFAAPPRLECIADGKSLDWKPEKFVFTRQTPVGVNWTARSSAENLSLDVDGRLEYDGNLQLKMTLRGKGASMKVDAVRFVVPWAKDVAQYAMGLGLQGGKCPEKLDWKWDVAKHQDAIWLGDANIGLMLRFKGGNYERPLINAYYDFKPLNLPDSWGSGGISLEKKDGLATLVAASGPREFSSRGNDAPAQHFNIDWYFIPFKPLDVQKHFTDRYYHATQGSGFEDPVALKEEGVNVLNIHHNRLCNPYINYPYNDDSIGFLTDFIKKAHTAGVRVKIYYTTRELTQNLPEFFALRSLDGEVILPRRDGVGWPVTNRTGPHPWLRQHVGMDIVPAWKETLRFPQYAGKLDLAVITTPDSRWNNFYLEGLNYLVRKAGIDGLYIDDTALDRQSMQRARRILDADGNPGRRIDMHSWNHFNNLAKWANSSVAFMELYPYYDRLWHGEGFKADMPPEYWLIEMSGIPYGLMSEMLQGGGNPWRGMLFGMTRRWPWSGDPRPVWKVIDRFGITDSELIGWWDPACPVQTGNGQVKASVYRKPGRALIALASWAPGRSRVKLAVDWRALGLNPARVTLWAPEAAGFQREAVFAAEAPLPVPAGKGLLLIADETPRQLTPPADTAFDPLQGLSVKTQELEPFEIKVPANTVKTRELAWPAQARVAVARIAPQQDEGQSWGVGLAVGWPDGKYVQINARTDGRWGIRRNGAEKLEGDHPRGKPATVAVRLEDQSVQLLAQEDGASEWELVAEYPRSEFPGAPAAIRVGKLGTNWNPRNHRTPGGTTPCRVEWVKIY